MFFPALAIRGADGDLILASVDDYSPTAVDEHASGTRVFFTTSGARDAALAALAAAGVRAEPIDVDDEDWARRSQQNLAPISVGRVTVISGPSSGQPLTSSHKPPIVLVIRPSMGFGTGHHATTRLCLAALQTIDLNGAFVVDVGTGSGVLAIAAARLGAARAVGLDNDPDAVRSARDSLAANPEARGVEFEVTDLTDAPLPLADVMTANLTGAQLTREAGRLVRGVRPGGTLIVSGLLAEERDTVRAAFNRMELIWESAEDGWVGFGFRQGQSR